MPVDPIPHTTTAPIPPWTSDGIQAAIVPDPNKVAPPLDANSRREMIAFIHISGLQVNADLTTSTDAQLIGWYKIAAVNWQSILTHNGGLSGLAAKIGTDVNTAESAAAAGINSVTDFLKMLADPKVWLRVLEVLIGLLLLGVGIAKIYGGPIPGVPKSVSETLLPKGGDTTRNLSGRNYPTPKGA